MGPRLSRRSTGKIGAPARRCCCRHGPRQHKGGEEQEEDGHTRRDPGILTQAHRVRVVDERRYAVVDEGLRRSSHNLERAGFLVHSNQPADVAAYPVIPRPRLPPVHSALAPATARGTHIVRLAGRHPPTLRAIAPIAGIQGVEHCHRLLALCRHFIGCRRIDVLCRAAQGRRRRSWFGKRFLSDGRRRRRPRPRMDCGRQRHARVLRVSVLLLLVDKGGLARLHVLESPLGRILAGLRPVGPDGLDCFRPFLTAHHLQLAHVHSERFPVALDADSYPLLAWLRP
eukprot:scaffold553_cov238-Pinguiococcus_pyrenoidosus.AAC.12